ncbi:MAG: AraC family transcriptional regulator [Lachnospiraceae bacterium]|nr:AraC family transcriptional regulator [Lachnospiraceae bacterium]
MNIDYGEHTLYIERQIRHPSFGMNYEHSHNYTEIYYLKSGSCVYTANRHRYHLSPGDLFIVKARDPHSTLYNGFEPSERIVVAVDLSLLPAPLFEYHPEIHDTLNTTCKVVLGSSMKDKLERIFSLMLEESATPDDYSSDFMIMYMLNLVLLIQRGGVFTREHPENSIDISPVIEKAINYIALNYNSTISLDDIAGHFHLCPSHFSKKFSKETGYTFKEYLNYIRLRQATQMLLTTDDSITKIALSCGFNSSNYFKDLFRKKFNMSPRTFRRVRSQG